MTLALAAMAAIAAAELLDVGGVLCSRALNMDGGDGDAPPAAAATAALCSESSPGVAAVGKAAAAVLSLLSDDTAEDSAAIEGAMVGHEYTAESGKLAPTLVTTLRLPSALVYQDAGGFGYGLR